MKKTHILETDLKTLNGESLLGEGDISVEQSVDASTLTTEQLDYLRDKQIKYGMWNVTSSNITNFSITPGVTKLPIFNRKHAGSLVANNNLTFTLKAKRLYKVEVYIILTGNNSDYFRFSLYNDLTNARIGSGIQTIAPPTNTINFVMDPSISEYIEVEVDTPISVRLFRRNDSTAATTIHNLNNSTRIHIAEISSFDVSLKNFKINGKSFDENNNIDLEGLSTLSSTKLNEEVLTEKRHPVTGKPLYRKTINYGALPNNTSKIVSFTSESIDRSATVHELSYCYNTSTPNLLLPINYAHPTTLTGSWNTQCNGNQVFITTGMNRSTYNAIITVEYTKTTDTAESPVRLVGGRSLSYTESETAPENPIVGDEWYNPLEDRLFKYMTKTGVKSWYEIEIL